MLHSVSISTLKNHTGEVLERARREPVQLERFGKPIAVIIPYEDYITRRNEEDAYWGKLADEAIESSQPIGHEATKKLIEYYLSLPDEA